MFTGETLYTPPTQTNTGQTEYAPSDITFQYGQDIARWAVVKPYDTSTIPTITGSILNLYDIDYNTYLEFIHTRPALDTTTTIDFDFNRLINVRGAFLSISLNNSAGVGAFLQEVTFSYTQDNINWVVIDTEGVSTSGATWSDFDLLIGAQAIRGFRITWFRQNSGSAVYNCRLRQFSVLV